MITCDQCREELPEHALGQLPAESSAALAEHLAACPVCRHESAALAAAWSALPMALAPMAPSADLFERIASRIDDWPEGQRQSAVAKGRLSHPHSNRSPLTGPQRILSYALAASVFIGLTAVFFRMTQPSSEEAATISSVEELVDRLGRLQRREAERLLQSERIRIVSLHGPKTPTTAQAYVVWDLVGRQWHFYASDLPAPPDGKTYQLWAAAQDSYLPGPTFNVNQGLGSAVGDFPTLSPSDGVRAIITLEPAEGSKQPSGKAVLEAVL
jgi:hypothetical protein